MPAESISWRSYWIEAHQRRLVAWCCAQGGVSGIRVAADDKGVEVDVEVDERRAQSMSTIVVCYFVGTEQWRCARFKLVDDVDELWLSNNASQARKICSSCCRLVHLRLDGAP